MEIKIALPKGRLLRKTASILQKADWRLDEYHSNMGFYRPKSQKFSDLCIRVFHEKDIPIQIAMGNYDLGICGLDWIEELLVKYPSSDLVKVKDLMYGNGILYMAIAGSIDVSSSNNGSLRIASEYPNLAETYALRQRISRFSIFPVWGGAEVYPPENADMVLLSNIRGFPETNLVSADQVLDYSAFLIANRRSWERKNLETIVTSICDVLPESKKNPVSIDKIVDDKKYKRKKYRKTDNDSVRLALPDGHQQQPTASLLDEAGVKLDEYPSEKDNRRPKININGVSVKVIRPQDMPLQVANGNFDLAITGRDWLTEHLNQFPSSPVRELVDLKYARVRLVAVVSQNLTVEDTTGLRQLIAERSEPFRVASEYVNIADRYARDNHLGHYRIIPTWGATEAFLPEDADMLIENTETGRTIARHNLKIIDTLFISTGCLIGNTGTLVDTTKSIRIKTFVKRLSAAVQ